MKSRSVVIKALRNKAQSQKPPCSQGMQCPYRNEYQHQMEFSHDSSSTSAGKGKSSALPFNGGGHRLGGGMCNNTSKNTFRGRDYAQDEWLRALEFESHGTARNDFIPDSLEDKFCCELCNDIIPLSAFDAHLQHHTQKHREKESSSLRKEQDREYEQSVRMEQEKERQHDQAAKEAQRLERLKLAGEKRRRQREQELEEEMKRQRQAAKENLRPEPDSNSYSGKALTLRFILPSGIRLTRRFRAETVMQDVRDYLLTVDELFAKTYILRSPGQEDVRMNSQQFVLKENTTFVVMIQQDAPANAIADATATADLIEVEEGAANSPVAKRRKQQAATNGSSSKHVFVDLT